MTFDPGLLDRVRRRLADDPDEPDLRRLAAALRTETRGPVGAGDLLRALPQLRAELFGAGPLDALLRDPRTTDVLVNGPAEVWVDQGQGLLRADVGFPDAAAVRRLAGRLAAVGGRRLDDAQPWVDVRLPDGTRLHAVLPPLASRGPYLSLRVLRHRAFTLDELVAAGTLSAAGAALLQAIVAGRLAFLVCGGTGSGKTTLLSTLLGCVPAQERIVVVEDCVELRPAHPHVLSLEARLANVEGAGAITLRDLVRQALRMRPDRLVVGEVRGAEVIELLTALNTGHEGGAGTLHANSGRDVPARLEALAGLGGMAAAALHSQLGAAVHCVLHLRRDGPRRVLEEVSVLHRRGPRVGVLPAWRRDGQPAPGRAFLAELLAERGADPAALR
ncbi:MAG: TadA family conjugal transfer-associated ATPase [Actinomycetota bacterium]|nr:TadA family conjugal transfer-associated ATPase [Actinomycetota bacterium]